MSRTEPLEVSCPGCGTVTGIDKVHSISAHRHPELRDRILDGTLQQQSCTRCQEVLRLEPRLSYLDTSRGQWISAQPLSAIKGWSAVEEETKALFATAFGTGAAREIGEGLSPRLTFGWAALREKLVAQDSGLDDVTLELMKLAIIRSHGGPVLQPGAELRLLSVDSENLFVSWIDAPSEQALDALKVPRALYDEIEGEPEGWAKLRAQLTVGPFVDIQRLFLE